MALLNANLQGVQAQDFTPIPPGPYKSVIANSEVKESSKNNMMLKLTFMICDGGPHNGRQVFEQFVLSSPVAMSRLKSLALCAGHPNPDYIQDSEELHGLEVIINVKLEIDKTGQYEPKNKISSFKKPEGAAPIAPPSQAFAGLQAPPPVAPPPPVQQPALPPVYHHPAPPPAPPAPPVNFFAPPPVLQAYVPPTPPQQFAPPAPPVAPSAPIPPAAPPTGAPWES
jgi:hypothetical protein